MADGNELWKRSIIGIAGLLGAAGVALGAASAHLGGGDFARLASFFLLLHAAAIPGILAVQITSMLGRLIASSLLAAGSALFSGDLAALAFTGRTPVSGMAPLGGLLLIAGWLALASFAAMSRTPSSPTR